MDNSTLLFVNGRIFQAGPDTASKEEAVFGSCMLVRDGVIVHVGVETDEAVRSLRAELDVKVHDLGGRTVLPGFMDGHMHLLMLGQSLQKVSLVQCKTLDDIRAAIRAYAKARPEVPRILAHGWMHAMTPDGVSSALLDDLDPRPIFVDSKDLHSTWCSTAALEEMGLLAEAKKGFAVAGGTIHRDGSTGRPTGLLEEAGVFELVWPHLATVASVEERASAIGAAVAACVAAGYTGVVDMAMDEGGWEGLLHYAEQQRARGQAALPLRIAAYWLVKPRDTEAARLEQVERAAALSRAYAGRELRVVGIKVVCDGIVDACTAVLTEPYGDPARTEADAIWTEAQLRPVVAAATAAGLQVALHAIGDATVRMALDVFESVQAGAGPGPGPAMRRPRIEHLELTTAQDAARLGRLGVTASIQPVHADPAILRAWPRLLGADRCGRAFAYREFADGGAPLALGTDAPTAPHAPLANMYVAATRRSAREPALAATVNPHFALGLSEALAAATAGAAYSCGADDWTGRLEAGKTADFVVVDMAWDAAELLAARVRETWLAGRLVFRDTAAAAAGAAERLYGSPSPDRAVYA